MVPFYKYPIAVGGGLGVLLTMLAIVGSSNAVNLTDGLDGLAIGCTLIVSFVFLVLTYLAGNVKAATYLQIPYVSGASFGIAFILLPVFIQPIGEQHYAVTGIERCGAFDDCQFCSGVVMG